MSGERGNCYLYRKPVSDVPFKDKTDVEMGNVRPRLLGPDSRKPQFELIAWAGNFGFSGVWE